MEKRQSTAQSGDNVSYNESTRAYSLQIDGDRTTNVQPKMWVLSYGFLGQENKKRIEKLEPN